MNEGSLPVPGPHITNKLNTKLQSLVNSSALGSLLPCKCVLQIWYDCEDQLDPTWRSRSVFPPIPVAVVSRKHISKLQTLQ